MMEAVVEEVDLLTLGEAAVEVVVVVMGEGDEDDQTITTTTTTTTITIPAQVVVRIRNSNTTSTSLSSINHQVRNSKAKPTILRTRLIEILRFILN